MALIGPNQTSANGCYRLQMALAAVAREQLARDFGGTPGGHALEGGTRVGYCLVVAFGPVPYLAERGAQALSRRSQFVFDPGRNDGEHGSLEQAVALHFPQGLGQHLLADSADQAANLREAQAPVFVENLQCQHGPFVGHPADDLPHQQVHIGLIGCPL